MSILIIKTMNEIWKYIETRNVAKSNYKKYDVYISSEGRVKKIYNYDRQTQITHPTKSPDGARIYVTVAKMFPEICGEWFDGCTIDHINTDRTDNRAINLRICTVKENTNNPLTKLHCSDSAKERFRNIDERAKISNTLKTYFKDDTHRKKCAVNTGKHFYNNGNQEILAYECPNGFVQGRIKGKFKHTENAKKKISEHSKNIIRNKQWCSNISKSQIGRHWYTNGVTNVFRHECPTGFYKGITK